jgi:glycosyltransferase involved in cell wall biosynthesis
MLNVLHLIYNWGKGGFESYVHSLVEKLHGRECNIYIAYSERVPVPELVEGLGIQTFHIPMKSPYDFKAAGEVANLCKKLSIHAVHTHFIRERYISAISRLFGNRARLIYTSHVIVPKSPALKLTNRIIHGLEDNIIAVCGAGREQMLTEGLNKNKIEVIYNGVDIGFWGKRVRSTIRSEFSLKEEDFVITSAGRFNEVKGHRFLLECARRLIQLVPENEGKRVRFFLVGEGELLEECRKLAVQLGISGNTVFAGFRSDIRNIFHGSDLYVSSSKSEALSMSIIEALACGLPVVATNVGGTSEVVNEENQCGCLVEYGDVEGFARAMLKFMEDREFYSTRSSNASRTAAEKFSLDKMVKETYNLYLRG